MKKPQSLFHNLLLLLLLFTPLISPQASTQKQTPFPAEWIIDTDMGPDDVMAILYFLKQPKVNVRAITIEGDGNAHCQAAFRNLQGLLLLLHQTQIPLACGRTTPLRGTHHFPKSVLKLCDSLANTPLQKPPTRLAQWTAKDLLIKTLKETHNQLNILALGPLTTLAEVFTEHPKLKAKVHMIYIMGGAIKVPGNIPDVITESENHRAEWNIYLDPYAAQTLFQSGLPLTLIPLDVTNQALIDQSFYLKLKKKQNTPTARFVYSLLSHHKKMLLAQTWYFWDPMAAVIARHEELAHFEILPLTVQQSPEALAGTTVIDLQQGANLRVALKVHVEKMKETLLEGWNQQ